MSATVINLADYKQRMRVGSELSIPRPGRGDRGEERRRDRLLHRHDATPHAC